MSSRPHPCSARRRWTTVALATLSAAGLAAPAAAPGKKHRAVRLHVAIDHRATATSGYALPPVASRATPRGPRRVIALAAAADWSLAWRTNRPRDQAFLGHFDGLTPENAMKMTYVEPRRGEFEWTEPDALVQYALDQHKTVRGHPLIWYEQLPGWLTRQQWSRADMLAVMGQWIGTSVGHYRGKVVDWDVLNELFDKNGAWRGSPWFKALGTDLAETALRMAHAADPGARLFINDFDIEEPGPKQDALYALAKDLKSRGVPFDGIGFEAHWSLGEIVPEPVLLATMRRFAALGLHVELTELDITIDQQSDALTRQADAYAMAGRVCQSIASCDRVTVWGIGDGDSWRGPVNRPLLFDNAYAAKPAYAALRAALAAG
jgi:endo-1,4-beta-xylanase